MISIAARHRYIAGMVMLFMISSCSRPIADFQLNREDVAPARLVAENQSKNAITYSWDFGDGHQSTDENPAHTYIQSGNYAITLVVTDEKGKSDTKTKRIMIEAPKKCLVEISTDYGDMIVELFDETPKHRDNFYQLAEEGFYDGLLFHRVIDQFMIQGGDPESRGSAPGKVLGTGGPGYQVPAEIHPDLLHVKGALAAARQGDAVNPDRMSSGSQFYLVQGRSVDENMLSGIERRNGVSYSEEQIAQYTELGGTPFLDGQYTVFGRVIEGIEVLDKIAAATTDARDRPQMDIQMRVTAIK